MFQEVKMNNFKNKKVLSVIKIKFQKNKYNLSLILLWFSTSSDFNGFSIPWETVFQWKKKLALINPYDLIDSITVLIYLVKILKHFIINSGLELQLNQKLHEITIRTRNFCLNYDFCLIKKISKLMMLLVNQFILGP